MAESQENPSGETLNIGAGQTAQNAESAVETAPAPVQVKPAEPKGGYWWGTGRRKSSVARVRIKPGKGKLVINKKEMSDFFPRLQDRNAVMSPLKAVDAGDKFDVFVNVKGGGTSGQSGATRLGIARALKNYDPKFIQTLREGGHLTRDGRMVERKKPGQRGARRRFQFSKR